MRFLIDASMSPVVVQELRRAGHDAIHVGGVLRLNSPDVDSSNILPGTLG